MPSLKPMIKLDNRTAAEEDLKKPAAAANETMRNLEFSTYMSCSRGTCGATASVKRNPTS
jgi:hypothetical protein